MPVSAADDVDRSGITLGATGQRSRWAVSPWGSVRPWTGESTAVGSLDWYVAADDRWHRPADEPTLRQQRLDGTAVVETRVRVPEGDVVQRVWAVPDDDGAVAVEFENASPLPVAVAVHGEAIVTDRPPSSVPVDGIDLPDDTIVLPIGHHSTVRIALGAGRGALASPPALSAVRGWTRVVEQASRLLLPDPTIAEAVVAARCDLLLEGPVEPEHDPVGFLLDVGELVRCGDDADAWLIEVVEPVERLAATHRGGRFGRRSADPPTRESIDAVTAVRRIAAAAGDDRAVADVDRLLDDLPSPKAQPAVALADLRRVGDESVGRFVRRVERRVADQGDLLPGGIPSGWLGADFEVHGVPTGPNSAVGFAVRWHGERPAVLWEQHGVPTTLTARSIDETWSTSEASGEALWTVPSNARLARRPISLTVEGVTRDGD